MLETSGWKHRTQGDKPSHMPIVASHTKEMPMDATTDGSGDQGERLRSSLQALIVRMAALVTEISSFNVYVATQDTLDRPLNMWPGYADYPALATASAHLQASVKCVNALANPVSVATCCINIHTFQAREMTVKVSNITANVMKTMADNAKDINTHQDANANKDQDAATTAIMADLAQVIEHVTAATESTWAAVDLLESIRHEAHAIKGNRPTKIQYFLPWMCCIFTAFMACVTLYGSYGISSHLGVPQISGLHDAVTCISEIPRVCDLMNGNLDVIAQIRNATVAEFDNRFDAIEKALAGSAERVDNVWEALGPPNADGTYFAQDAARAQGSTTDGHSNEIRKLLDRIAKLEADALEFKRQVQRSEVRVASRLNNLDRRRGG